MASGILLPVLGVKIQGYREFFNLLFNWDPAAEAKGKIHMAKKISARDSVGCPGGGKEALQLSAQHEQLLLPGLRGGKSGH